MKLLTIIMAVVLLTGCSRKAEVEKAEKKEEQPNRSSTASQVIDGMTGRGAVKAGKQAMETIRKVSKQESQNLDEAIGE